MSVINRLLLMVLCLVPISTLAVAQVEPSAPLPVRTPREFTELRGMWILDEAAGKGHIAGLPVAHTLSISTTPFEISLAKDDRDVEIYKFDGSESAVTDAGTGAVLNIKHRLTLVAGTLALTSARTRGQFTNIITDAYAASGDTLTVERQLSVLAQPPGSLVTLSDERNNRQTLVYRRSR
jgi:hypothetical protein